MAFQLDRKMDVDETGVVLFIEKMSIHDGQGLRTVIFLKGCPLKCQWCSTPESQSDSPERGYLPHLCKGCGTCVECCPQNALSFTDKPLPLVEVDKKLCISCFTCVAECPQEAVKGFGKKMTVHEVVHEIEKDEVFYFHSKGGVTISGGECLQQALFVQGILQECRKRSIETAIETTLFAPWKKIESLLPYLNHVYADIKHGDPGLHRTYTGVDNQLIHKNLHRLDSMTAPLSIHVRIPLIPGINDSDESLLAMLHVVARLKNIKDIELLPYHRLGSSSYELLQLPYPLRHLSVPEKEYIAERANFLRRSSGTLPIKVGGGL